MNVSRVRFCADDSDSDSDSDGGSGDESLDDSRVLSGLRFTASPGGLTSEEEEGAEEEESFLGQNGDAEDPWRDAYIDVSEFLEFYQESESQQHQLDQSLAGGIYSAQLQSEILDAQLALDDEVFLVRQKHEQARIANRARLNQELIDFERVRVEQLEGSLAGIRKEIAALQQSDQSFYESQKVFIDALQAQRKEYERKYAEAKQKEQELLMAEKEREKKEAEARRQKQLQEEKRKRDAAAAAEQAKSVKSAPASASGSVAAKPRAAPKKGKAKGPPLTASQAPSQNQEYMRRVSVVRALRREVKDSGFAEDKTQPIKNQRTKLKMRMNRAINIVGGTLMAVNKSVQMLQPILADAQNLGRAAHAFVLEGISERIVAQGAERIKVHQATAFPFALVAFYLSQAVPAFCDIFLGALAEVCVFTVPCMPLESRFKTPNEYKKEMKFTFSQDEKTGQTVVEDEVDFLERMQGYISLYSAFVQIKKEPHPHGRKAAWAWLSKLCNSVVQTNHKYTAQVLITFLEVGGYAFQGNYPKSFNKIIFVVKNDIVPKLHCDTPAERSGKLRLESWVDNYIKIGGKLDTPEGRNMPDSQSSDAKREVVSNDDYGKKMS